MKAYSGRGEIYLGGRKLADVVDVTVKTQYRLSFSDPSRLVGMATQTLNEVCARVEAFGISPDRCFMERQRSKVLGNDSRLWIDDVPVWAGWWKKTKEFVFEYRSEWLADLERFR